MTTVTSLKTKMRRAGMIAASGLVLAAAVLAQQSNEAAAASPAAAAVPAPATATAKKPGKLYQDWGIACEAQVDKTQKCFVSQYQFVTKTGKRLVNMNVGYIGPKGEPMIVAFLPLGLDLKKGAAIKFDPGPSVALNIVTCTPEGCRATAMLDAAGLKGLREAKTITVWFNAFGDERAMNLAISVKGLAAAFAALK